MTAPTAPAWFAALTNARIVAGTPANARAVRYDSRRVEPGDVFVAVPGLTVDGHGYIPQALERRAGAIVVQESARAIWEPLVRDGVAFVAVPDTRIALAAAAAGVHAFPARDLLTVGVTGTDGKTTTSHLIAHVLTATGTPCGLLSSVQFAAGGTFELNASHMTTLEAPEVQAQLAKIRDAGDDAAAVEASSIGLDMHRVDQCEFDVGVFTNLAPDHLDYHQTMDAYRDAKALLFRMVASSIDKGRQKAAIINADDPASESMRAAAGSARVITYGLQGRGDITASEVQTSRAGMTFVATTAGKRAAARTPLLGDFNVYNCLAAVGVAVSQGARFVDTVGALSSFPGVPGRMEAIDAGQPFRVIVDIASTEQAMANVLRVLRPATTGRLIALFGAAGERDRERRSGIARAVAAAADEAFVTNEDPRTEDPLAILREITSAFDALGYGRYTAIEDRRAAIAAAFAAARPGDTVLLAGKGTEQSIVIGTTHHPWDERTVARDLLSGHA